MLETWRDCFTLHLVLVSWGCRVITALMCALIRVIYYCIVLLFPFLVDMYAVVYANTIFLVYTSLHWQRGSFLGANPVYRWRFFFCFFFFLGIKYWSWGTQSIWVWPLSIVVVVPVGGKVDRRRKVNVMDLLPVLFYYVTDCSLVVDDLRIVLKEMLYM